MDTFSIISLVVLFILMGLDAWWAFRSYKRARWVRFAIAVTLLVLMGFGWQYFPVILFLLVGPFLGLSFS